ncbi:MAG TPA: GGDEF domain-containing protein [Solirubrobacterales bacterium]|nr:GGDEF domain-containing protein [Solirubrobacterales bacterium]
MRPALAAVLFGGTALVILHNWFGLGGADLDDVASGELYDSVVVAAGLACLLRARAVESERSAWVLIGTGVLAWAAAEIYWTAAILDNPEAPYPSLADAGYLAFYPLTYAGLVLLVRARAHEIDWRLWTDGAIAALGTAALGAAFVFDFVAKGTTGTTLEVATSLAYPLCDIGMLAMVVGVVALTGWHPGRTWSLLLAGLAAMVVADIAYTVQATGGFVPPGNWIDPIYLISATCIGAILWQPSAARIEPELLGNRRELMVPAIFATVMIGLFGMQHMSATSSLTTMLWAATMLAVIVRLAMSVRENRALLEQVRTDSLTRIGNRGAMQVDFESACERTAEGSRVTLILFDLNGFKRYNDSFGHPAGDELLARLGQGLKAAVGDAGAAYRIGGDEFCVVVSGSAEAVDAVAKRAAEGLTASNHGVEVSASWGAATVPDEASDPSEAMQLADVRMYAQKESRRLAHPAVPPVPEASEVEVVER